jgi:hypothetical protein
LRYEETQLPDAQRSNIFLYVRNEVK